MMKRSEVLSNALRIAEGYGGNLMLRQLYYRFVAPLGALRDQQVVGREGRGQDRGEWPADRHVR